MYSEILIFSFMFCVAHSSLTTKLTLSDGRVVYPVWVPKIQNDGQTDDDDPQKKFNMDGETPMCESRKVVMQPIEGVEKDSVWNFFFQQGITTEGQECVNAGGSCKMDLGGIPTKCVQKYIYRVTVSTEGVEADQDFKIPGGCTCSYGI